MDISGGPHSGASLDLGSDVSWGEIGTFAFSGASVVGKENSKTIIVKHKSVQEFFGRLSVLARPNRCTKCGTKLHVEATVSASHRPKNPVGELPTLDWL